MTIVTLKEVTKGLRLRGISKLDRTELTHVIQVQEGQAACYARIPDCEQMDRLFRPECLPEVRVII